jgi:hypothetical protein
MADKMESDQELRVLKASLLENEFEILEALRQMGFDTEQSFTAVNKVRDSGNGCNLELVLKVLTEGEQESPRSIVCKTPGFVVDGY